MLKVDPFLQYMFNIILIYNLFFNALEIIDNWEKSHKTYGQQNVLKRNNMQKQFTKVSGLYKM